MSRINIVINNRYYSKDPSSSDLGKRIVNEGIALIGELGFEQFTFKKLAERIASTEASVYRYFENKQKMLIYLSAWYWSWADYQIDYNTHHLSDPMEKLNRTWEILCHIDISASNVSMDVDALRRVVIRESDKTYLTKDVDEINKEGLFKDFKSLCHKIAENIQAVKPDYQFPRSLVSTLMEASHQQYYFAKHLPSLTEIEKKSALDVNRQVHDFVMDTVKRIVMITDKKLTA